MFTNGKTVFLVLRKKYLVKDIAFRIQLLRFRLYCFGVKKKEKMKRFQYVLIESIV